ncbi:MAG: histidine phosphatase family protein [Oligoflexia bacterium]|nr:histidine phosphatase family protein [Oligoflexia bacterium]
MSIALIVSAFAGICASGPAWATPAQVLIIRHGEKPDSGSGLSDLGQERAQALVSYFENDTQVTRFGTPAAIYAMAPTNGDTAGLRPVLTVTPLAQALGLSILDSYAQKDVQPLAQDILSKPEYDGKMVLICWEHHMIPAIAAALGVQPQPDAWGKDVYDQVWEIDFTNGQVSNFQQYQEALNLSRN